MKKVKSEMTIHELGRVACEYLHGNWRSVLDENKEELIRLFPEYEDATYGMYLDKLIPPLWKEFQRCGFTTAEEKKEGDFVIADCLHFSNSLEKAKWGTPQHEIRVFWIVVKNERSEKIGTLLFELSHSHLKFDLPAAPQFFVFEGTERRSIVERIRELREG
ncbi:DUF6022 family protein [Fictibacillus fluitans]|uniref:DUF6022 family protein n=1 Tax=Fictibacillus fluitans TaxID=3058422 RepID=A0ABT8I083_9BACL|nr:DUF6022 family protein [Fictibacillus sp. NE201]MDN4526438.1 DUF6022 family protein [Fictibacillus sp. NE201]